MFLIFPNSEHFFLFQNLFSSFSFLLAKTLVLCWSVAIIFIAPDTSLPLLYAFLATAELNQKLTPDPSWANQIIFPKNLELEFRVGGRPLLGRWFGKRFKSWVGADMFGHLYTQAERERNEPVKRSSKIWYSQRETETDESAQIFLNTWKEERREINMET